MMRSRLPVSPLPDAETGAPVELQAGRGPVVVFTRHSTSCAACANVVNELRAAAEDFGDWGARLLTVTDPQQELNVRAPALLVADEWGEVYFQQEGGIAHELPTPNELVEWARFIAIQCPECEQPEGEWRTL